MTDQLYFNGINGATGKYDIPPMSPEQLKSLIAGETLDEGLVNELRARLQPHFRVMEGVDPADLAQSGWGVIFGALDDQADALKDALKPLLELRESQAGERYREFSGGKGYRPDETKNAFLARHGAGPGAVDPDVMPYYLLIVGDPETIPYRFQNQLDVQHAVGRIHFDTLEEYARYAQSVVDAETGKVKLGRKADFFGVRAPDDPATRLSADEMIKPLSVKVSTDQPQWDVRALLENKATKTQLGRLLGGDETPALLFTASHGMGFPSGDARQFPHQGALLCQDWPGPVAWREAIPQRFYFAADDIAGDARLLGSMAFFFACFGAGTPHLDEFTKKLSGQRTVSERVEIAPHAFLSELPRRLLGHQNGGMLAVVGHVDRAWGYSFLWEQTGRQLTVFESTLKRLMNGTRVGHALEYFNERYAEIASDLSVMLEDLSFNEPVDPLALSGMWTANNDARAYVIIGDPAAKLPLAEDEDDAGEERPTISAVSIADAQKPTAPAAAAAAEMTPTAGEGPEAAFGLFGGGDGGLGDALRKVAKELADALSNAVKDLASLDVQTFTTDDINAVTLDPNRKFTGGELNLRAWTYVSFDGDMQVCLPKRDDGAVDREVWQIHLDMVKEAQSNRANFLATIADLAARLVGK